MSVAIKFESVSKQYRLGEVGTGTLSHDLHRAWAKLRGKPDPFAKVGEINDRTVSSAKNGKSGKKEREQHDYVWALKDITLEVRQGEILGVVGRNGAGKSTLLKLLSRVTAPTVGNIKTRGRLASLLEVGTGFHPELTGRENVYLNGAIMGMTRPEITRQLEEIVEFSGCAKYIDTPVKRYSSGMMVRLGFAVAAHLECQILIVDEVLAVGDSEFQNKCIGKMQEVSSDSGRTILFVSHNLGAVSNLCTKAVLLQNGGLVKVGRTDDVIQYYIDQVAQIAPQDIESCRMVEYRHNNRLVDFCNIVTAASSGAFGFGDALRFVISLKAKESLEDLSIGGSIYSSSGDVITTYFTKDQFSLRAGVETTIQVDVLELPVIPGRYTAGFSVGHGNERVGRKDHDVVVGMPAFEILPIASQGDAFSQWHHSWGPTCWSQKTKLTLL